MLGAGVKSEKASVAAAVDSGTRDRAGAIRGRTDFVGIADGIAKRADSGVRGRAGFVERADSATTGRNGFAATGDGAVYLALAIRTAKNGRP